MLALPVVIHAFTVGLQLVGTLIVKLFQSADILQAGRYLILKESLVNSPLTHHVRASSPENLAHKMMGNSQLYNTAGHSVPLCQTL